MMQKQMVRWGKWADVGPLIAFHFTVLIALGFGTKKPSEDWLLSVP
jgi:hypothetical protein